MKRLLFALLSIVLLASCRPQPRTIAFRAKNLEAGTISRIHEVYPGDEGPLTMVGDTVWVNNLGIIDDRDSAAMKYEILKVVE